MTQLMAHAGRFRPFNSRRDLDIGERRRLPIRSFGQRETQKRFALLLTANHSEANSSHPAVDLIVKPARLSPIATPQAINRPEWTF